MASIPSIVPLLPPAIPSLQVGAVAAAAPVALASFDVPPLPLPSSQPLPQQAVAVQDQAIDGAAMRPDQVFLARQIRHPDMDSQSLAQSWRSLVRHYGDQLAGRTLRAHTAQLPSSLLAAGPEGSILRQPGSEIPPDAWRFTIRAGSREHHLGVVQAPHGGARERRRLPRAALRLELELDDGTGVVLQVEPMPGGLALQLCASDAATLARLRALQEVLEKAVERTGLQVLLWRYLDRLPPAPVHARIAAGEAPQVLTLPVFRAVAELALALPREGLSDSRTAAPPG